MKKSHLFLLSSLFFLPGCTNWFSSEKKETEMTQPEESQKTGAVLLSVNGKPAIYEGEFEATYKDLLDSKPEFQQYLAMMPAYGVELRKNLFEQMALQKLASHWVKTNKIDQNEQFKKDLEKQLENIKEMMAIRALQLDIVDNIKISDAEANKYYEENKEKLGIFRQAPFLSEEGSTKASYVEFGNEKSANEFAEKAKKQISNFDQLAKENKKTVIDLGFVNMQTPSVDASIRVQLANLKEVPSVFVSKISDKKYYVVKAANKKEPAFAPFENVKKEIADVMKQTRFPEKFKERYETLKKDYNVNLNENFFDAERRKLEEGAKEQQEMQKSEAQTQATEKAVGSSKGL